MRKCLRIIFLLALFTALLCVAALAAEEAAEPGIYGVDTSMAPVGFTVSAVPDGELVPGGVLIDGAAVDVYYAGAQKLSVSVTGAEGPYQLILATNQELVGDVHPTESNIVYIDQNDSGSFNVYPSEASLQKATYYVYLADSTGLHMIFSFRYHLPYRLGDIDNSGVVNSNDALLALQIAGELLPGATATQRLAADVVKDGLINANDALKILQYAGNIITSWD